MAIDFYVNYKSKSKYCNIEYYRIKQNRIDITEQNRIKQNREELN